MRVADFINWDVMLDTNRTSRYAGSHVEQMENFLIDAKMIASKGDNDYTGHDSMVFLFTPSNPDFGPKLIIVTSYFGSCCACDGWENSSDDEFMKLLTAMANNSRLFDSFDEILNFFDHIIEKINGGESCGEYYDLHKHVYDLRDQVKTAEIGLGDG